MNSVNQHQRNRILFQLRWKMMCFRGKSMENIIEFDIGMPEIKKLFVLKFLLFSLKRNFFPLHESKAHGFKLEYFWKSELKSLFIYSRESMEDVLRFNVHISFADCVQWRKIWLSSFRWAKIYIWLAHNRIFP